MSKHIFTSVTANYIPKARVLAASVKKFHPEITFHLMLSDDVPEWLDLEQEAFDDIIHISDLAIPDLESWIFKHSLVELCTAVKGFAFKYIIEKYRADKVIYFDPDIAIFSKLDAILDQLDSASILLTPHQTVPDSGYSTIVDNEICSLKHGVFNLGFLAVQATAEGKRFVDWWADRLGQFCYDDIPAGLFTDQRWIDLAPCFFADLHILREPIYNVSTWNLSQRVVTGSFETGIYVNDLPLCFYHFSGFDSGAQKIMLNKYGSKSPFLKKLRNWYIAECNKAGQQQYGTLACCYNSFDNGAPISKMQRFFYRSRQDLISYFPNPFSTADKRKSYYDWYLVNAEHEKCVNAADEIESPANLRDALVSASSELTLIKNSTSWRMLRVLHRFLAPLRR